MARLAHPEAMAPTRPGSTRVAPPQLPARFPFGGRYLAYTLFGATGLLYLLVGLVVLRVVWALGDGPGAWRRVMATFEQPGYIAFHLLTLAAVIFVAVRFFWLFPKSQPPRLGPFRPPPRPVIHAMLHAAWLGTTALMSAILAGWLFP